MIIKLKQLILRLKGVSTKKLIYFERKQIEEELRALLSKAQKLNISERQVIQIYHEVHRKGAEESFERLMNLSFHTETEKENP